MFFLSGDFKSIFDQGRSEDCEPMLTLFEIQYFD